MSNKLEITPASDKQIAFLEALIRDREIKDIIIPARLDQGGASELIDLALTYPKIVREAAPEGHYHHRGDVYRVVQNKAGTSNYAMRYEVKAGRGRWKFAPGVVMILRAEEAVTVAEATALCNAKMEG